MKSSFETVRLLALAVTIAGATTGLAARAWLAGSQVVSVTALRLPPQSERAICMRAAPEPIVLQDPRLSGIVLKALKKPFSIDKLAAICQGLRALMPLEPTFPRLDWDRLPEAPIEPREVLQRWSRGLDVDALSVSNLAMQLARASQLQCRLVKTSDGELFCRRGFAGFEFWYGGQEGWIVVDPVMGVLLDAPHFFLSLAEARLFVARGRRFSPTVLVPPLSPSPLGRHDREFATRLRRMDVAVESSAGSLPIRWAAVEDGLYAPTARRLDGLGFGLCCCAFFVYGTLLFLVAVRKERELRAFGSLALGDVGALRRAVSDLERQVASEGVRLLHIRTVVGLELGRSARTHGAESLDRLARAWRQVDGAAEDASAVRLWYLLLLGAVGTGSFLLQALFIPGSQDEDAFIGYRYARNLAEGRGFTFNAGEPGVEGFSNTLWLLLLAAFYKVHPNMPDVAAALGLAVGVMHVWLLAYMACRLGHRAWLPLLIVTTNVCFARGHVSGLETSLVAFLTSLVAFLWGLQQDDEPMTRVRTSLACFALSLARADGWFLFGALSTLELLRVRGTARSDLGRSWFAPFGVLACLYLAVRVHLFGSIVPHIYYGRLIAQRGGLWQRLPQGIAYLANTLFQNPAYLLGVAGIVCAWRRRSAVRLAAVALAQFALVVVTGGDVEYIGFCRFAVPAMPCLALLTQQAVELLEPHSRRATATAAIALVLLANSWSGPSVTPAGAWVPNPLVQTFFTAMSDFPETLRYRINQFRRRRYDPRINSFDAAVARHLEATTTPKGSLACGQAGQIAYGWRGPFRDVLGLSVPAPWLDPYNPIKSQRPDRYLLFEDQAAVNWDRLAGAGYRLERVYWLLWSDCPNNVYILLGQDSAHGVEMKAPLVDTWTESIVWSHVPRDRYVLFYDTSKSLPLYDGQAHWFDSEQFGGLPPELRYWVTQLLSREIGAAAASRAH
ncbi:MAG: hypothetical protein HY303_03155 [Candidatus Wallbacteria bacterium]|nr:hypothetical protein [Candidatus Wallbacteria bacterium]